MRHLSFKGVFPILQTPFNKKGEIVFEEVENEVDWLLELGVHGIGIAIASEVFKLNDNEKFKLLKTVVDRSSGKIPIIMNSGQESTEYTIYLSKKSEELGAKGLMINNHKLLNKIPKSRLKIKILKIQQDELQKKLIKSLGNKAIGKKKLFKTSLKWIFKENVIKSVIFGVSSKKQLIENLSK